MGDQFLCADPEEHILPIFLRGGFKNENKNKTR